MTSTQRLANDALESLRESVNELMERKRRLGEYVVVWQDGKIVRIPDHKTDPKDQSEI